MLNTTTRSCSGSASTSGDDAPGVAEQRERDPQAAREPEPVVAGAFPVGDHREALAGLRLIETRASNASSVAGQLTVFRASECSRVSARGFPRYHHQVHGGGRGRRYGAARPVVRG